MKAGRLWTHTHATVLSCSSLFPSYKALIKPLKTRTSLLQDFYFTYIHKCFAQMCVCVPHVCPACKCQKGLSDSLRLGYGPWGHSTEALGTEPSKCFWLLTREPYLSPTLNLFAWDSPGWFWTWHVTDSWGWPWYRGLELQFYQVLGIKPRAWCTQDMYSPNWAMSPNRPQSSVLALLTLPQVLWALQLCAD